MAEPESGTFILPFSLPGKSIQLVPKTEYNIPFFSLKVDRCGFQSGSTGARSFLTC